MNALSECTARALRALSRLLTLLLLGSFVLGLLLLGVAVALLSVLWSLLRGKRPAMFTVLRTFQQASRQFGRGPANRPEKTTAGPHAGMPWPRSAANQDQVVDVQALEVRPALGERPQP
jgi:hypothetical protein